MESVQKIIFCPVLKHDINSSFIIEDVKDTNGDIKLKSVSYYDCDGVEECDGALITNCPCFKEMKRVEREINFNKYF